MREGCAPGAVGNGGIVCLPRAQPGGGGFRLEERHLCEAVSRWDGGRSRGWMCPAAPPGRIIRGDGITRLRRRWAMLIDLIQVPYDSGHRGERMGAGPGHLVANG